MTAKQVKIAELTAEFQGRTAHPYSRAYVACFNRGMYHEAHDVLEVPWREKRHDPSGNYYKGLIQLAGAFYHARRGHPQPATALLKLARANLRPCPALFEGIAVPPIRKLISQWMSYLKEGCVPCPAGNPCNRCGPMNR